MRPAPALPPRFAGLHDDWLRWLPMLLLGWLLCIAPQVFAQNAAPTIPPAARDAALESTIARSLRLNPVVASRRSEVSAARHEIDAARWQYAPTVSTQLQAGTGGNATSGSALRADQRIYTGGRIEADVNAAASRRDSAVLAVQESGLGVALQVVGAWQAWQAAQGQTQAIAQYRARLDRYDAKIARRIDNGVSPQSEQALVGARLAQSDNDRAAVRAASLTAQATLQRLTGGLPGEPMPVPPEAGRATSEPPVAAAICIGGDTARESALDRHPALRRLSQDIESARFSLQSQRAAARPAVTLRLEQPVGHQPHGVSRSPRVSLLLEMNSDALLAGGARADSSAERVIALSHQLGATRRELGQQIEAECAEQANVAQRLAGFQRAGGLTAEVLASYERLFVAGRRGWLDVLNAAREDFENQQGASAAQAALQASHYRLALLSGDYALGLPGPQDEAPMTPLLTQIGQRVADAARQLVARPVEATPVPILRDTVRTAAVELAAIDRLPALADVTLARAAPVAPLPTVMAVATLAPIEPARLTAPDERVVAIASIEAIAEPEVQPHHAERLADASDDPLTRAAAMHAISSPVPSASPATWTPLPAAERTQAMATKVVRAARPATRVARLPQRLQPARSPLIVAAAPAQAIRAVAARAAPTAVQLGRVVVSYRALPRPATTSTTAQRLTVSCIPRRDCDPREALRPRTADAAALPARAIWQVAGGRP